MISRLFAGSLKEKLRAQGSLQCIENRCTGESTAKALIAIGTVMSNGGGIYTHKLKQHELEMVQGFIYVLELQFIKVTETTLSYNIKLTDDEIHKELAGL